jgi:hypothetical protein
MMRTLLYVSLAVMAFLPTSGTAQTSSPPLAQILSNLGSTQATTRQQAFDSLLGLSQSPTSAGGLAGNVPQEISSVLALYPTDAESIKVALINLLTLENAYAPSAPIPSVNVKPGDEVETDYGEYFAGVVAAVASLRDVRAVPGLLPLLSSGHIVIDSVASLGRASLDSVITVLYSPGAPDQAGATFTMIQMLVPENYAAINDPVTMSKLRAGLQLASSKDKDSFMQSLMNNALQLLPPAAPGDLNGDRAVNCGDVAVIRTALGKSVGQPGFDIRADVNGDGVVNNKDLTALRKLAHKELECEKGP